jgi:hypothetical protein
LSKSENFCRIPAKLAGIWRRRWISFYIIVIFSYEPNTGKYFQENYFF